MGYVEEARENHVKKKVEEVRSAVSQLDILLCRPFPGHHYLIDRRILPKKPPSKMKQKALKECDQYTSKYAECASGRTISIVWQCRKQAKELNGCLHQYTNDSVLEEMKKNYMLQQEKRS